MKSRGRGRDFSCVALESLAVCRYTDRKSRNREGETPSGYNGSARRDESKTNEKTKSVERRTEFVGRWCGELFPLSSPRNAARAIVAPGRPADSRRREAARSRRARPRRRRRGPGQANSIAPGESLNAPLHGPSRRPLDARPADENHITETTEPQPNPPTRVLFDSLPIGNITRGER